MPVIELHGQLDAQAAPLVSRAVERALEGPDPALVIDLAAVDFMDSAGLRALVEAQRRSEERDRRLRVVCPPGHLRRVFTLTGLSGHLLLCPSREEALRGGQPRDQGPSPSRR